MAESFLEFPNRADHSVRASKRERQELRWRGLLLGVGNVLCDATLWRRWLCRTLNSLGYEAEFPQFFLPWDIEFLPDICSGKRRFRAAFASFLCQHGLKRRLIEELTAAATYRLRISEEQDKTFLGVKSTLLKLTEMGVRLAAVDCSHLTQQALETKLARLGMTPTLSAVFASRDVATTHQSGAIHLTSLQSALAHLGLRGNEAAYFGGEPLGLRAARGLGMSTIAYRHVHQLSADDHIIWFSELTKLCQGIPLRQSA